MVVNCLPLYDPPDEEVQATAAAAAAAATSGGDEDAGKHSPPHTDTRSTLIKARSMESITSSQLGDDETHRTDGEVATPPRRKSSKFGAHYTVTVNNTPTSSTTADGDCEPTENYKTTSSGETDHDMQANSATQPPATDDDDKPTENDKQSSLAQREVASQSDGAAITEEGSADSAKGDKGNKEESETSGTNDETAVAKSDHVQPDGKHNGTEEVKLKSNEKGGEDGAEKEHTKLRKTQSERSSLSPEGDLSDSGEVHDGLSVNYIQDPFVVPQLKRSSGSVSFFTHTISTPIIGAVVTNPAQSGKDNEELSSENREKSLSTIKPPILEEANSLLQQSGSSPPTAPTQSSSPLTTSPPPGATTSSQAPSTQLALPCLLYTSPSPRDATLSRMPSSA